VRSRTVDPAARWTVALRVRWLGLHSRGAMQGVPSRRRLRCDSCTWAMACAPRLLPAQGRPRAVALRSPRRGQPGRRVAPRGARPCRAHM